MDNKFVRIQSDDDPNRCQGGGHFGQCPYVAVEHSKYCSRHGGNLAQQSIRSKIKKQYDFAKWQASIDGFADYDDIKSLRYEVGVMRMLLQNLVSLCKDETDLIMYTSKISEIISEIKALVVSMHKLDTSLGSMLDKTAALNLAAMMVEIVSIEIADDTLSDKIGRKFAELVLKTGATVDA